VGNRYFINSVATVILLNLIAVLPQPFLNKNSSELPLFATAPFAALKKIFGLCFTDVGSILKNLALKFFFVKSC